MVNNSGISEINKSTSWTKSIFQVFLAALTIIFFAINAFMTFSSFLFAANASILEKQPKELVKVAHQIYSELFQTTSISLFISIIAGFILIYALIMTFYNAFLSKRKFVTLCLYETYY